MKYLSEKEYDRELRAIRVRNMTLMRRRALRAERRKYLPNIKFPSTSKMILLGAVLLCLEIVIFCEYVMYKIGDTSAMYVLIGIPATLIPVIWGYYSKSKAENTVGGITYDMAMKEYQDRLKQHDNFDQNQDDMNPVG